MNNHRIYVEKYPEFQVEARSLLSELNENLQLDLGALRYLNVYDLFGFSDSLLEKCRYSVFGEIVTDSVTDSCDLAGSKYIAVEFLPGQFDQRAASAVDCVRLIDPSADVTIKSSKLIVLPGDTSDETIAKIKHYYINTVESREKDLSRLVQTEQPEVIPVKVLEGLTSLGEEELAPYCKKMGLAMNADDLREVVNYFKKEGRDPYETELRILDTYWSDHCRHTTFTTELEEISVEDSFIKGEIDGTLNLYMKIRKELGREHKGLNLMDMATVGARYLKAQGLLDDMEVSEENNACSIHVDVDVVDDEGELTTEKWLLQFKNETHNHPTEIEPFGGAATCLGGAIRDPLSGRAYVYQAMRVTGAADIYLPVAETIPGKLPQSVISRKAAHGYSSYGNQIGLATTHVREIYHDGYLAKRLEVGAVVGAVKADSVRRESPAPGDVVLLLGGRTGRDGIGGATGSSKVHTEKSVSTAAAEVQKGNAVEERKIQRLFRNKDVSLMIRRCNDFGAGGVSVAVGELAPGLDINLDAVPKKYDGLNGTELAISESQERMAVVVRAKDAAAFIKEAAKENLQAVQVAVVTDTNRLVMKWRGNVIVDIGREFLDAAGAHHEADALIESPAKQEESPLLNTLESVKEELSKEKTGDALKKAWLANISDLSCCSQRGLGERFDGSIGASTVLFPYGGKYQCTPEAGMCAKIPVVSPYETSTVSFMAQGYDPRVGEWSAWHGAQTAVLSSLAKIACMGGKPSDCRLSFQEFFGRAVSEKTWGYPAAALLGSIDAQTAMGCASIGGKDSMSGTFEEINVPHTLVSFAVTHGEVQNVTSGSFKKAGDNVYLVTVPYSAELAPDFDTFTKNTNALYELNKAGKIAAMYPVCAGGIAEAITKMAMGNRIGIKIDNVPYSATASGFRQDGRYSEKDLFTPLYGSIIVEAASDFDTGVFVPGTVSQLGATVSEPALTVEVNNIPGAKITLKEAESAWESTLSSVFPPVSGAEVQPELPEFAKSVHPSLSAIRKNPVFNPIKAKPRVVIPVFPGTNCEYDIARAFNLAGADTNILVLSNKTPQMLEDSLAAFEKELKSAQILALAGGFSAGDEPDGSAKFIANCLREGRVSSRIMELLKKRDGLVLGICNGFQALVKTGLAMYGEFRDMQDDMPTLTFNRIGRHISRVVRTRLVSAASPWALDPSVIDPRLHLVPVSHGEGRFVVSAELAEKLFANGQVFSQYVDEFGVPAVAEPDNPNGSAYAIEGITSPDGRVLGKMGHSERTVGIDANGASRDLIKNIAGDPLANENENSCENVFAAGVRYFK